MPSSYDPNSPIRRELLGDERVLWQGRPAQGLRLTRGDIFMIPFSLLWGGFAFFWEATALGFQRLTPDMFDHGFAITSIFPLWGIPFCLIGLYMIVGRFFYDAWRRGRTDYGVTDKRILIVRGNKATALTLAGLNEINIRASGEGRGTITFGPEAMMVSGLAMRGRYGPPPSPAFEGVPEARKVYRLIQQAIADLKGGARF